MHYSHVIQYLNRRWTQSYSQILICSDRPFKIIVYSCIQICYFGKHIPLVSTLLERKLRKTGILRYYTKQFQILHELVHAFSFYAQYHELFCVESRNPHYTSFLFCLQCMYVLSTCTPVQHSCAADPVLTQIKSPPEQFIIICKAFACIPPAQSID